MVKKLDPSQRRRLLPEVLAARWRCIPLAMVGDAAYVATDHPDTMNALQEVQSHLGVPAVAVAVTSDRLRWLAAMTYADGVLTSPVWQRLVSDEVSSAAELDDTERAAKEKPVVRLVDEMLAEAVRRRASDIHLEPGTTGLRVRFRLDGLLVTRTVLPISQAMPVVGRIKILSRLNLAERRLPQDGRLTVGQTGGAVDLRVSTFPTMHGEKVVLRLLDRDPALLDPANLGMPDRVFAEFTAATALPRGMLLVTGPTGSGKTTTLYAALVRMNRSELNIITIEDPIEYALDGISQTQVKEQIGLTFGTALRHALRQDPDIIMVGEIRDRETADIAVRAALTGHLVLSTLHTNDAAGAIVRLLDMGVEAHLLASCLELTMAQRLVRRLCPRCRVVHARETRDSHVPSSFGDTWFEASGCDYCAGTGYRGRQGIFESFRVDDTLRDLMMSRLPSTQISAWAHSKGLVSLEDAGRDLVIQGVTSPHEYFRVLGT